jgi:putative flippase GtrA
MQKTQLFFNKIIDFIYPLFGRFMPKQLFSYAFSGGFTTAIDFLLFYFLYYFIFNQSNVDLGFFVFKPHVAAQLLCFIFTIPLGFFMQKTLTFTNSSLRVRVQLFRYLIIVAFCIFLNLYFIKFFMEYCHLSPTISKIFTTIIVVTFSYFSQRNFSFAEKKINDI